MSKSDTTEPGADDRALVRRAKAGDSEAYGNLVARHERRIYSLAWRILQHEQDAEDVTQETFLSALEGLKGFREEASFGTWLARIATHAALKIIRKRQGLDLVSLDAGERTAAAEAVPHPEFIADWKQSPERLVQHNENRRVIEAALAQLAEKHRLVFILRDVEGLAVKETAAVLGLTEANVKVRLLRARLQLREQLTRAFGDARTRLAPHTHEPGENA
jgi:RNA polymerase sigma-70 factor (ECF subfamily)